MRWSRSSNPTELTVTKSVPWQRHKSSKGDVPVLEFTSAEPRTLQVVLLFDSFTPVPVDVHELYIAKLEKLLATDVDKKRPPLVQVEWGTGFPTFRGVVKEMSVKYTLFLENGTPCRATATLIVSEAIGARPAKGGTTNIDQCQIDANCGMGEFCFNGACAPAR